MSKVVLVLLLVVAVMNGIAVSILQKRVTAEKDFLTFLIPVSFGATMSFYPVGMLIFLVMSLQEMWTKFEVELLPGLLFFGVVILIATLMFFGTGAGVSSIVTRWVLGKLFSHAPLAAALTAPLFFGLTLEALTRLWGESFLWNTILP